MKLTSLIQEELVLWNLPVTTFERVYELMSHHIADKNQLDKHSVHQAFKSRIEAGGLVVDRGICLVHGRIPDFDDLLVGMVHTSQSIPMDPCACNVFIFLLTSRTGSNLYVKTLACVAKLIKEHSEALRTLRNSREAIEYLDKLGLNVSEALKVRDIMSRDIAFVQPEDTIKTAIDVMKARDLVYLPVVDKDRRFLGKLYMLNILILAYPDYMLKLRDIPSTGMTRAFEELTEKENTMFVKDLYDADPSKCVDQDMSVYSMGFNFIKNKWRHAAVIDNSHKIVGIISIRDILNNVIRV